MKECLVEFVGGRKQCSRDSEGLVASDEFVVLKQQAKQCRLT